MIRYSLNRLLSLALLFLCIISFWLEGCGCNPNASEPTPLPAEPVEPMPSRIGKSQGIPNIGSSCYMNSVIQILVAFYEKTVRAATSDPLVDAAKELIETLTSKDTAALDTLKKQAKQFFDALSALGQPEFKPGEQADATELLTRLLDYFKNPLIQYQDQLTNVATGEQRPPNNNAVQTYILPMLASGGTMQDLFKANMMPEEVDVAWKDPKVNIKASRQVLLDGLGGLNVFSIQLVRYTNPMTKINTKVTQPFNLLVKKEWMVGGTKDLLYDLVGFIQHDGSSPSSGHYTAYVKEDSQWICYDDSTVSAVSSADAETAAEKSYVFFYQPSKP